MMIDLDDSTKWQQACLESVRLGGFHAVLGEKASSAKQLIARLTVYFGGQVRYRRFHLDELRKAYGASYNGIAKVREAKARGL